MSSNTLNNVGTTTPDSTEKAILAALNDLIDVCKDGAEGYKTAAHDQKDEAMRGVCSEYSQQRDKFASELQAEIQRMGYEADQNGTLRAAAHRGWINLKSAISSNDTHAILAECRAGDQIAVDTYERVLQQNILPQRIQTIVQRQYDLVRFARDNMESLAAQTKPRA